MKRAVFFSSLAFVCIAATAVAFDQPDASKACPFNISGLWRSDTATEMTRTFFSFSPQGHVTLLGYSPDALPQDFEVITSVGYRLDRPTAPKEIVFTAARGNDVFPSGLTAWTIVRYGDDSFTTMDPASGGETRWVREQTHRYFLTFGGRSAASSQGGAAFATLTVMDGRETKTEALGVQITKDETGKAVPTFGPIPAQLYDLIVEESEKEKDKKASKQDENVIMRFELSESEYGKIHRVYQTWEKQVTAQKLPSGDAYLNAVEFMSLAAEGLKPCGNKAKLNIPTRRERDETLSKLSPSQQPLEYIRITRKRNEEVHVTNSMYPWVWRPLIQQP